MNITNFKMESWKMYSLWKMFEGFVRRFVYFDDKNELKIKEIDCFG